MMNTFSKSLKILALCLVIGFGAQIAFSAWGGAPGNPPSNNKAAPINVTSTPQGKGGTPTSGSLLDIHGLLAANQLGVAGDSIFGDQVMVLPLSDTTRTTPEPLCADQDGTLVLCPSGTGGTQVYEIDASGNQITYGDCVYCGPTEFIAPVTAQDITVEIFGAGGGGGGSLSYGAFINQTYPPMVCRVATMTPPANLPCIMYANGGGGGGGAYSVFTDVANPAFHYQVTVGKGGAGGVSVATTLANAPTPATNGQDGGDTSFIGTIGNFLNATVEGGHGGIAGQPTSPGHLPSAATPGGVPGASGSYGNVTSGLPGQPGSVSLTDGETIPAPFSAPGTGYGGAGGTTPSLAGSTCPTTGVSTGGTGGRSNGSNGCRGAHGKVIVHWTE